MKIAQDIEVIPYAQLGAGMRDEPGHGIFIDCCGKQINVGAIVTLRNDEVLLNIQIVKEMPVANYQACEMSKCFDTFEAAVTAAHEFLAQNRRPA